jgi:hypothetical protein
LVRDRNTPQKVVWRARIVLLAGDGTKAGVIARTVGKSQRETLAPSLRCEGGGRAVEGRQA